MGNHIYNIYEAIKSTNLRGINMNLKKETKNAFAEVQRFFPFDNYIHKSTFSEMYAILRELKRYLPEFRKKRLLDIGCGPMEKTAVFQSLGFRCCAADDLNDPWHHRNGNIKKIKEYAKKAGINFCHQKPGEYTIPFEVGSFDVVCSLSVIEHLHESPRGMLNFMGTLCQAKWSSRHRYAQFSQSEKKAFSAVWTDKLCTG